MIDDPEIKIAMSGLGELGCSLAAQLEQFNGFGRGTRVEKYLPKSGTGTKRIVPVLINEFWTSKQRQANALHEISYRACFKPQLPRFFIERLTSPGDVVYDPLQGRGTTLLEAALMGRVPWGNDASPLSRLLILPRLNPPTFDQIKARLSEIDFGTVDDLPDQLLVFYHPTTLRQLCSLRKYLLERRASGALDIVDSWIWMVAINRLTGHSKGFFSVYTLPPNQAVSVQSQQVINQRRNQVPPPRDVPTLILKKTKALLKHVTENVRNALHDVGSQARFFTGRADQTPDIPDNSVSLVVTSPPFLDVVDYAADNWLRSWFAGIDPAVQLTICRNLQDWKREMTEILRELHRVLKPGGHVAFEVGEVRHGSVQLEDAAIPAGTAAGLEPLLVMINEQAFTKTANCWGVDNNQKGTNTNRVVLFRKS